MASIDLFSPERELVAILVFLSVPESELPPAEKGAEDNIIRLYYTRDRLADVIDQLRNERRLTVNLWTGLENNSHLGSGKQRVGSRIPARTEPEP